MRDASISVSSISMASSLSRFPSKLLSLMFAEPGMSSRAHCVYLGPGGPPQHLIPFNQSTSLKPLTVSFTADSVSPSDPPSPSLDRGPGVALTNDDCPVICNEQLAVDIDELRDQVSAQLSMCAKPTDGHVIPPRCPHCTRERWGRSSEVRGVCCEWMGLHPTSQSQQ